MGFKIRMRHRLRQLGAVELSGWSNSGNYIGRRRFSEVPSNLKISEVEEEGEDEDAFFGKQLRPKEMMAKLDEKIIGQTEAKKGIVVALRNRWRRQHSSNPLANDIVPSNILMTGPTGCGKTEIARQVAKLINVPFVKVEATGFTEVGYHGKDVGDMIEDLVKVSEDMLLRKDDEKYSQSKKELANIEKMLKNMETPKVPESGPKVAREDKESKEAQTKKEEEPSEKEAEAEIDGDGSDSSDLENDYEEMCELAREGAEQMGIVFIDEIDKLITENRMSRVSTGGVQRDLLPLIEGTTVNTKKGKVDTRHIMFICAGTFYETDVSQLMPELQGRLPVRVEMQSLNEKELMQLLETTDMLQRQVVLFEADGVSITFTSESKQFLAKFATECNQAADNLGVRRLHQLIEKVVEDISFHACADMDTSVLTNGSLLEKNKKGQLVITKAYAEAELEALDIHEVDLQKFII